MARALDPSKAIPIIAIVDDDDAVREATAAFVRSLGYSASTFASAEEFLKSEQVGDTSCLITDVRMPGMSGIDLQFRLIADGHRIPIIFMTGHPDDSVRKRAMKAGAVGFLAEPVDTDRLSGYLDKGWKPDE
jgi:FixJ family two-component response regulator